MSTLAPLEGWTLRAALRRARRAAEDGFTRLALRGVARVGARPRLRGLPFIESLGTITIGDDFELSSTPVQSHLVTGPHGRIRIGDGVKIGYGAAIAAEASIEIGDGAHLAPMVMILDTDYHVAGDPAAPPAAAPVVIGPGARLGKRVTVLRGATIGKDAVVEPGSVVSGVVPDGARVSGVPARVVVAKKPVAAAPPAAPAALSERVLKLGAEVFALAGAPTLADGPATIPAWDSLGALRLLVTLEDDLGIHLPSGALAGAHDFAAVCDLVARAGPSQAPPP
jgi:acetyltransferase-like isoleucine patch superfamily enzyme/acyl carrier protein